MSQMPTFPQPLPRAFDPSQPAQVPSSPRWLRLIRASLVLVALMLTRAWGSSFWLVGAMLGRALGQVIQGFADGLGKRKGVNP